MPLIDEPLHRHLVRYRYLTIGVMVFCGYLMLITLKWSIESQHDALGIAAILGAVYTPIAAIFKFALDFALDGKIDK
jgi:hypothetical protein